jgi:asparagine synthase (glutamine-hydrolysing)
MCGVAGVLGTSAHGPAGRAIGERMSEALVHRGPDSGAVWQDPDGGALLVHRRLSIIDLSSDAGQPMRSPCGRYLLSYNGEIYNFHELRQELVAQGEVFATSSDTEVLLRALVVWGTDRALRMANGMFAFALWDRHRRALFLARDRFGEKPLYYLSNTDAFLFGSELRALLCHPACPRVVDREALADYFRLQYVPAPLSILKGVRKLEPGAWIEVSSAALSTPRHGRYWNFEGVVRDARQHPFASKDEAANELHDHLRRAVKARMVADVPLGALLSGGIDSSLVVALMQSQSTRPVKTFTIGFDEVAFDESRYARPIAAHLGTEHSELVVRPADVCKVIDAVATIYDEPFSDSSQLPTFLVSKLARAQVTVALSGDGGDELFGGYGRYSQFQRMWRLARLSPGILRAPLERISGLAARVDVAARGATRVAQGLESLAQTVSRSSRAAVYESLVSVWRDTSTLVRHSPHADDGLLNGELVERLSDVEYGMFRDTLTYLPDDILTKVDRAAMSVGLETRVPLLDPQVVECAWRLPISWKAGESAPKMPLRRLLRRYLPAALFERPKIGFGIPIGDWLRGPLRTWASDMLSPATIRKQEFLDERVVARTWADHLSGRRDRTYRVWTLLVFQMWLRDVFGVS